MDSTQLEKLTGGPRDGALLRLSLGRVYAESENYPAAVKHLRKAVEMAPDYSAAWVELGRVLQRSGQPDEAACAWRSGIEAASRQGDKQAEKMMRVFLRRVSPRDAGRS